MGDLSVPADVEPTQTFRERLPRRELRTLISCVWVQQVRHASPPYLHRTIPNGSTELVWTLGSHATVAGPQTGPQEVLVRPGTTTIGLRFRPGVVPALLGVSASEIVDLEVEAAEFWGRTARAFGGRLEAATSPYAAIAGLELELLRRVGDRPPPDPLVLEAVRQLLRRGTTVSSLAGSLYVSDRQLHRRVEIAVGIAPKRLQRLFRFQRFLALMQMSHVPPNLSRLAREAGYADQSHLSREAVQLAGRTPGILLQHAEEVCRCAHDHSASYRTFL